MLFQAHRIVDSTVSLFINIEFDNFYVKSAALLTRGFGVSFSNITFL